MNGPVQKFFSFCSLRNLGNLVRYGRICLEAFGCLLVFGQVIQGVDPIMNNLLYTEAAHEHEIKVNIRWMLRRDMKEVLEIESDCFEFAWDEDDFMQCLQQRNCIGMVAEYQGRVVGFMIYELQKTKIHLLNVATLKEFRRKGVGAQLVAKLIAKLGNQRRSRIILEVRETNLPAQLFLRSLGFLAIDILHGFYDGTQEDAYLMVYRHQEFGPIQRVFQPIRMAEVVGK